MAQLPLVTAVLRLGSEGSETPQVVQLVIPRCETALIPFEVIDEAGTVVNLTNFTLVASFGPQDGPATLEIDGTVDVDPSTGTGFFLLSSTETNQGPGVWFWDMEAIDSNDASSKVVLRSLVTFAGGVWRPE